MLTNKFILNRLFLINKNKPIRQRDTEIFFPFVNPVFKIFLNQIRVYLKLNCFSIHLNEPDQVVVHYFSHL